LIAALLAVFLAQAVPKPSDFPITEVFKGTPAAPKLTTAGQKAYRTLIREWAAKGPNFAGHYALAQWGCGAGCLQIAVVDLKTGAVYEGPFGALRKATMCLEGTPEAPGIAFQRESALLVLKGCPDFKNCGAYYYQWTGSEFKLLRRDLLAQTPNCQP
jgi:hypothetical protein